MMMIIRMNAVDGITAHTMISPIQPYTNYSNIIYNREQSFKGSASLSKKILNTDYKNIDINSAKYITYGYKYTKARCKDMIAEVNVETERLLDIVKSQEPCIFIMNHTSNQMRDIDSAKFFEALLYREYIYHNMEKTCPRSKVLSGLGVLKHQADGGEQYKWLGVVETKTDYRKPESREYNRKITQQLSEELAKGKINLFLFPEGVLSVIPFVPIEYKFQPGCASIIKKVLELKDKIKVIPICFAHNKTLSAIHIGEPVYIKKQNGIYSMTRGNLPNSLYEGMDEITLTEKGKPVDKEHVVPYISGMLLENMKACIQNAKNDLKNSKPEVFKL